MPLADCRRTAPVSFLEHLTTLQFIIYPYGTLLYTRLFIAEDACKLLHYIKHRCKYTRVLFMNKRTICSIVLSTRRRSGLLSLTPAYANTVVAPGGAYGSCKVPRRQMRITPECHQRRARSHTPHHPRAEPACRHALAQPRCRRHGQGGEN